MRHRPFACYWKNDSYGRGGWFRVFGYGLWYTDQRRKTHRPLFTERNNLGTWKYARTIGHWKIRPLVRNGG